LDQAQSADDEERGILLLTSELCAKLNAKFSPIGISWMGNLGHPLNLPSDQCFFVEKGPRRGFLVLPVALRGKLSLDDWRPIIASSMFHTFRPEFRRVWRTGFTLWIAGIVSLFAPFGVLLVLRQELFAFGAIAAAIAVSIIGPRLYNFYVIRRLRLKADRKAADLVGRDQFIQTLVKIDDMHILDLEELKKSKRTVWQKRVFPWPTMLERLNNLRLKS
jgi:hypothetical protein